MRDDMGATLNAVKRRFRAIQARYLEWRAPTILHITHWKAGSQWLHKILVQCCPSRTIAPGGAFDHLLAGPVQPGKIYPTVYATREQLAQFEFPPDTRRFIVIRDLRDTLTSLYFSVKISHVATPNIERNRGVLSGCNQEEGMLFLMEKSLPRNAAIQASWLGGSDPVVRYEDLLKDDEAILERVLREHCRLPAVRAQLRGVVRACRFESLTGGRQRGEEQLGAHERKGVAGDWRNYFTPRVKQVFKAKFGDLLIATGYEKDSSW
jgi:hypothetical protein